MLLVVILVFMIMGFLYFLVLSKIYQIKMLLLVAQ